MTLPRTRNAQVLRVRLPRRKHSEPIFTLTAQIKHCACRGCAHLLNARTAASYCSTMVSRDHGRQTSPFATVPRRVRPHGCAHWLNVVIAASYSSTMVLNRSISPFATVPCRDAASSAWLLAWMCCSISASADRSCGRLCLHNIPARGSGADLRASTARGLGVQRVGAAARCPGAAGQRRAHAVWVCSGSAAAGGCPERGLSTFARRRGSPGSCALPVSGCVGLPAGV